MPEPWVYREEPEQQPKAPAHPRTERVPWSPSQYSQTEHIQQLGPRLPGRPAPSLTPRPGPPDPWAASQQGPQPSFTRGAPVQPQYQRPPNYQPRPQPRNHQQQYAPPYQPPQLPPSRYTPPPARRSGPRTTRNVFAGIGGIIAVIIVIAIATNSNHGPTSALSAGPGTQAQTAPPADAPANTGPAGTTSELQALTSAQDYLSDGQGFSRQGLIDQLDSSSGDNFSVADATWGVNHSGANWDDQAVDCAKGYMSDGQGFSREGLIQQMTSAYGNQFTEAQAEYAANAVGL